MSSLTINIPEESMLALKLTPEQMAKELPLAAAVKLYEVGRLSAGAAAQLAGLPTPAFLSKLADYGVSPFRLTEEELEEDVRRA
jgi:predicted HTH domain antitoxin